MQFLTEDKMVTEAFGCNMKYGWDGMSNIIKRKVLPHLFPPWNWAGMLILTCFVLTEFNKWIHELYTFLLLSPFTNDSLELGNIAQLAGEMLKLSWAFFKTTSKHDTPNHTSKCKNESQRDKIEYTGFLK